MTERKLKCAECDWMGYSGDVDRVSDPRPLKADEVNWWQVCPSCRMPEQFVPLCDEPRCLNEVSCGTPTPYGYRNTCGKHAPRTTAEQSADCPDPKG